MDQLKQLISLKRKQVENFVIENVQFYFLINFLKKKLYFFLEWK